MPQIPTDDDSFVRFIREDAVMQKLRTIASVVQARIAADARYPSDAPTIAELHVLVAAVEWEKSQGSSAALADFREALANWRES